MHTRILYSYNLIATHTKASDDTNTNHDAVDCPDHTCIMKASMRYKSKNQDNSITICTIVC